MLCAFTAESGVRNEKSVAQSQESDAFTEVAGWLDAFPESAEHTEAKAANPNAIPFSEWCIVPIALLFIIGDMLFEFFG